MVSQNKEKIKKIFRALVDFKQKKQKMMAETKLAVDKIIAKDKEKKIKKIQDRIKSL